MLYNQLEGILVPFFMMRGGTDLAGEDTMQSFINLGIQDIYNKNNWAFLFKNEVLTTYEDNEENNTRMFTSTDNIITFSFDIVDGRGYQIYPTTGRLKDFNSFKFLGKNIYFPLMIDGIKTSITSIDITYKKEFIWYNRQTDGLKEIPLPNSFIPALIKIIYDYASPINLFDGEQNQVDFFGHYQSRIQDLVNNDGITEFTQFTPIK